MDIVINRVTIELNIKVASSPSLDENNERVDQIKDTIVTEIISSLTELSADTLMSISLSLNGYDLSKGVAISAFQAIAPFSKDIAENGKVILIEKITLNVDAKNNEDIKIQIAEGIGTQIGLILAQSSSSDTLNNIRFFEDNEDSETGKVNSQDENANPATKEHVKNEIFHYLEYGFFKWQYSAKHYRFDNEMIVQVTQTIFENYSHEFNQLLITAPNALIRFLTRIRPEVVSNYVDLLVKKATIPANLTNHVRNYTEIIIAQNRMDEDLGQSRKLLISALNKTSTSLPLAVAISNSIEKLPRRIKHNANHELKTIIDSINEEVEKNGIKTRKTKAPPLEEKPVVIGLTEGDEGLPESVDGYNISLAGMAILLPFLPSFFNALGLVDKGKFKGRSKQIKAVKILYYLATNQLVNEEHQLTFLKIICGVPLDGIIDENLKLSKKHLAECANLLLSIKEYWPILKNTSIANMQASFLMREGIMRNQDGDWYVSIDRVTIDILIDSIQWGYKTEKLPWNDFLIYVEW